MEVVRPIAAATSTDIFAESSSRMNYPDRGDAEPATVPIETFLESQPVGLRQVGVVILVLLVMILDGMDLQLLGLAAPKILKEWGLTKAMLGPALAMTVVGMAFGALCGGWLGDRVGRKPVMIGALCLIGGATVACGLARNVFDLAACRFVCGLGGGACFPGSATLIAEWLPRRRKSLAVGIVTVGIPVGGMLGATLVIVALARGGWRDAFFIGGMLPLALAVLSLLLLQESPSWRISKGGDDADVKALVGRVLPASRLPVGRFVLVDKETTKVRQTILGDGDRRTTLGLWLAFYMNVLATSGIVTWGTIFMTGLGFPMSFAVGMVFFVNLVAVGAMASCSLVTSRFGSRRLFLSASALAIVAIAFVGLMVARQPMSFAVAVGMVAAGGFLFVNQTLLYVIAAQAYPVEKRSTGVGLSSLVSRFGSITSAIAGGVVLGLGSPIYFLVALGLAAVLAATGALIIDRHVAPFRRGALADQMVAAD